MQLNAILQETCIVHGFELAVLTDMDGFALAYAGTSLHEMEAVAATGAVAWQLVQRMQEHIGFEGAEEYTLAAKRGKRLVCRIFALGNHQRMMVVLLLPMSHAYRRGMTRLVQQLKQRLNAPSMA
jgi:predicted regulator of Ras-like GTPase activity (Roadblock/LC7/MglB family)